MTERIAKGSTSIAFMLMTAALIAEALLLQNALNAYTDFATAQTLLTLSKIVVGMTAVTELALLGLWFSFTRASISNQRLALSHSQSDQPANSTYSD